jgi:indolepyruvate ferredoxin oxidoreductase beta subunit
LIAALRGLRREEDLTEQMSTTTTASQATTAPPTERPRAVTIAILAMGGEGGGVLADWIVDLAEHSGYCAQTTSVPGVAQRTGATIYYVEIFPDALVRAAGKEPVLALMPVPGEVDIVIASELMEAGRAIQRGLVTPDRTALIASTHRVFSMTERTAADDGRVDAEKLLEACQAAAKKSLCRDFEALASKKRSVISAVLFGALAGAEVLPFSRAQFEEAIRRGGVGVESSLAAFAAGADSLRDPAAVVAEGPQASVRVGPRLQNLAARIYGEFPAAAHELLLTGIARLTDYQDERYAAEYLDRLQPVREIDQRYGSGEFELLREAGRYLALWMTYEDAIRVADLKTRRTRFERVTNEARAQAAQLVQIHEFLYPRVEELTDILPRALGRWLRETPFAHRLVAGMTERGRIVQTTSLLGFLQLYFIAGMRRGRRGSLRFAEEQKKISDWLSCVADLAKRDYLLALEVAQFPRILRGYGETYLRGRQSFDAMTAALPELAQKSDAPNRVRKLREAAQADESGQKLAAALHEVMA